MAKRPPDYADRRSDGYTEPLELYVLGTSHVSEASAKHVRRVLEAVRPQSVVVEVRFLRPCFGRRLVALRLLSGPGSILGMPEGVVEIVVSSRAQNNAQKISVGF